LALLMMSTRCSKHVEAWNKYIEKERVKLFINQNQDFPPDRHVSNPPECVIPDDVLIKFGPPDDEHLLLETYRGMK
jgi:hypothetical protein